MALPGHSSGPGPRGSESLEAAEGIDIQGIESQQGSSPILKSQDPRVIQGLPRVRAGMYGRMQGTRTVVVKVVSWWCGLRLWPFGSFSSSSPAVPLSQAMRFSQGGMLVCWSVPDSCCVVSDSIEIRCLCFGGMWRWGKGKRNGQEPRATKIRKPIAANAEPVQSQQINTELIFANVTCPTATRSNQNIKSLPSLLLSWLKLPAYVRAASKLPHRLGQRTPDTIIIP